MAPSEVVALEVMSTADFDRRLGVAPIPDLVSVTQAAEELGVTRQAVLQRIESGSLPATQIGKTWAIPQTAIDIVYAIDHDQAVVVQTKHAPRARKASTR